MSAPRIKKHLAINDFLKIIAEENRLKTLRLLKDGKKCVSEIWQYLQIPQNLASHHLRILKTSGLISSQKEGLRVFYYLNRRTLRKNVRKLKNSL